MGSLLSRRSALGALAGSLAAFHIPRARADETLRIGKAGWWKISAFCRSISAMRSGLFQQQGLTVEVLNFAGERPRSPRRWRPEPVDISLSAGPDMAFTAKGSTPQIAIAAIAGSSSFMALVAGSRSTVHDIADLKGKQIGITKVPSSAHRLAGRAIESRRWLEQRCRSRHQSRDRRLDSRSHRRAQDRAGRCQHRLATARLPPRRAARRKAVVRMLALCRCHRALYDVRQHEF